MADEEEDPAGRQRAYLEEWLQRHNQQQKLQPVVVRLLSTAVWQEHAMSTLRGNQPQLAREVDSATAQALPRPRSGGFRRVGGTTGGIAFPRQVQTRPESSDDGRK